MIMELNTPLKNKTFAYQGFSLIFILILVGFASPMNFLYNKISKG